MSGRLRLVVHDYPGHAFPVQLSRTLAALGHTVLHLHFASFQAPKGPLQPRAGDPAALTIRGLALERPFAKYDFIRRALQERRIGRLVGEAITEFAPDVVLSGNAPLDVQAGALRAAHRAGAGFVFWMQDIYGLAIDRILRRKLPVVGRAIAAWYVSLERRLVRASDHVVVISDDFVATVTAWGVAPSAATVIENWAVRDELPPRPRDNAWARAHGLVGATTLLYAGTLGLKHDPSLLLALARRFAGRAGVRVVVVSEGIGADWLKDRGAGLDNLLVLPFAPFERLADVLASGDVLMAILEPEAGVFSVPSKVLSYLCAGRPLLAAIPGENLARRLIERAGAGIVVPPGEAETFLAAAERLVADAALRARLADNALDYAGRTFDIDAIAARFVAVLDRARALIVPPDPGSRERGAHRS